MPLFPLPTTDYPQHLTSHPELGALEALWVEVCGRRALSSRGDIDLSVMKRWAFHLSIAVVTHKGRFQFRLFGTELINVYGRDLTGRFLDELTPHDLRSVVILHSREVVKTRKPLFARGWAICFKAILSGGRQSCQGAELISLSKPNQRPV